MAKKSGNEVPTYQSLGKLPVEVPMKYKCQDIFRIQPNYQNMSKRGNKTH